jgi:hypothetical protein
MSCSTRSGVSAVNDSMLDLMPGAFAEGPHLQGQND